ncbi:MAG: EF-hand domain-containing protein [Pseudomonadota bacterium]|nr:EF-hand domain-containing protein [Pseudomonadota bacterium]
MHRLFLAPLLGAATLLASAGIHADDAAKGRIAAANSFAALDRNHDNRISRSEAGFDRVMSQTFAEIDTDGDGFVSPAEFAAAGKTRTDLTSR